MRLRAVIRALLPLALVLPACLGPALAEALPSPVPAAQIDTGNILAELARVLAFVILIESAMAAVFRWRAYRILFGGRALKTPIMFAVGWLVVSQFHYDIVARMLQIAYPGSGAVPTTGFSALLSALVIAGGSNGIADIFRRMGVRTPIGPVDALGVAEKRAWIAIQLTRDKAVGDIAVTLHDLGTHAAPPIAGMAGDVPFYDRFRDAFGITRLRFPREEGYEILANTDYEIQLLFDTKTAQQHSVRRTVSLAPGAMVDLRMVA